MVATSAQAQEPSPTMPLPQDLGNYMGHAAVRACSAQKSMSCRYFWKKAAECMFKQAVAAEDLGVAGPAHALVALGAVGGHVQEVVPLAPQGVQGKAVYLAGWRFPA